MADRLYLSIFVGPVVAVPAPKPLTDALTSAEIDISDVGSGGFQLRFTLANNSPLQALFLLSSGSPIPIMRVVLMATVGAMPQVLVDGVITHHEFAMGRSGTPSTLSISGVDLTSLMDLTDFSGVPFPGSSPEVRVLTILAKYAVFGIVPNVIPSYVPDISIPTDRIPTQKGTDLAYIKELAKDAGYVFYIEPGPVPGASTAYWGPQVKVGIPQPALNVNMDTWTNVESLNFRYEPQTSVLPVVTIQEPASKTNIEIPIPALSPLNPPLAAVIPPPQTIQPLNDSAKLTPGQAVMRGIARATETGDVVTGEGRLDVLRYGQILKARQLVGVRGAGLAFDGLHYVQRTRHELKLGEYKQSFTLKRNGIVSNVPLVPNLPI